MKIKFYDLIILRDEPNKVEPLSPDQSLDPGSLILLFGGIFLMWKSTREIHDKLEGEVDGVAEGPGASSFIRILIQIVLLDVVFSLDSVITAVGIADHLAVGVMMLSAENISGFIHRHPTVKMLALSFLLLIGMALVAEGLGQHIPKGYLYFAMGFSIFVEMLNIRAGKRKAGAATSAASPD